MSSRWRLRRAEVSRPNTSAFAAFVWSFEKFTETLGLVEMFSSTKGAMSADMRGLVWVIEIQETNAAAE